MTAWLHSGGAPRFREAMEAPRNNFTLLRLLLAMAVVFSHAFSVTTGDVTREPLAASTGFTLGEHAVNGFFAISGFLVTMSFDRRGWLDYMIARTLRIAPGLIAATLFVALALGGAMSVLPASRYYSDPGLWDFIVRTLTTYKSNISLPGVFSDNPFVFVIGTVWTLKYEVLCYAGVFLLGLAGLIRSRVFALILPLALAAGLLALDLFFPQAQERYETMLRLPLIFAIGAALYVWRDRARASGPLALALLAGAFAVQSTFLYNTFLFSASAYAVLWLAVSPVLARLTFEPRHDLSYGAYLYGWPIQQSLVALFPAAGSLILLAPALALSLAIALASWLVVEKPALSLKAKALGRRTLRTIEPAGP